MIKYYIISTAICECLMLTLPLCFKKRIDRFHDATPFYDWAENQKVPVYISEYTMPSDRFTEIATFSKRQQYNSIGSGAQVQEKIFIPKHQQKITQQLSLF